MSGDMEAAMTTSITDADMATATALASEHWQWCLWVVHRECCGGAEYVTCDCGLFDRQDAIAEALAAERAKALAPLLALADELQEFVDICTHVANGHEKPYTRERAADQAAEAQLTLDRIRAAAGPDRTAGEETP